MSAVANPKTLTRVTVCGAGGRMGRAIVKCISQTPGLALHAAVEHPDSKFIGLGAGPLAGVETFDVPITHDLHAAVTGADVIIDFTAPEASLQAVKAAAQRRIPCVVGTTGFSAPQIGEIAAQAAHIALVMAPNMSVGVNLLFALTQKIARTLDESYDAEIVELHHRLKKDAPSGTALRLANEIAKARKRDLARDGIFSRHGLIGERPAGAIGIATVRAGDIVGEHTVYFAGAGERIELTHRATSREPFAQGAVRAALWALGRKPGHYDMQHVLGLADM